MSTLRNAIRERLASLSVILAELGRLPWYGAEAERLYRESRDAARSAPDVAGRTAAEPTTRSPHESHRMEAAQTRRLWAEVDRFVIGGGSG